MKISFDILQKFVTPPKKLTARQLADTLTMSVVEVDGYEDQAERLTHTMVGIVVKVEPHPNADKLKLAQVEVGREKFDVVCGGVNLRVGMKVAFAKVGARVRWHGQGDWVELTAAKIRGQQSHGMVCAAEELGLPDAAAVEQGPSDGPRIMDLSHIPAKPGTPLAEALGLSDVIFDIDNKSITHRPDLWGHLGLARELAALWQVKLHEPQLPELTADIDVPLMVNTKAGNGLQRYLAVALTGVKVAPSPAWLAQALHSLGLRPINNIVDVTNYVMLEFGQPLHAFDVEKLASPEIVVRYGKRGEQLAMLDGVTRELDGETLVIADKKKTLAVAGVMGGVGSAVTETTAGIVLESATFEPIGVRRTASRFSLRTEASVRFEKALDPALAELALRRTVALLKEVCPSARVASPVVDVFPKVPAPRTITLSLPWLYKRLGVEISAKEVLSILARLGFTAKEQDTNLAITVPSWRATRDVTIPEDLVEEVARIYGYGKLPLTMPQFEITPPPRDSAQDLRWKVRDTLVRLGFTETLSYSFVRTDDLEHFGVMYQGKHVTTELSLELENPTDASQPYLRPTFLPNLFWQAGQSSRAGRAVRMFELGRAFINQAGPWSSGGSAAPPLPKQPYHLAFILATKSGNNLGVFREVKGVLEEVLAVLNIPTDFIVPEAFDHDWCTPGATADVVASGVRVGHVSLVTPALAERYDLPPSTVAVELSLDALPPTSGVVNVRPLPKYPSVQRDLSIVVPSGVDWEVIEKHVRSASPLIESVEVFDVYAEKGSIAFHLTFRSAERTLTSEEVDAVVVGLTQSLQQTFGARVRS